MAHRRAARTPAAAARSSARPAARSSTARAPWTGSSTKAATHAPVGEDASPLEAVLELQQVAGNQAVVQLLASGAATAPPNPAYRATGNLALGRIIASQAQRVVQREMAVGADPNMRVQLLRDAIRFVPIMYRYQIDGDKAAEALSNMTADDGKRVKARYQDQMHWNLGWVLSAVETPIPDAPAASNNLSGSERTKLLNLLAGTAVKAAAPALEPAPAATGAGPAPAAPAADPRAEKVAKNRLRVTAASIKTAIAKKDADAAIALIPASMEERREVDALYNQLYGQTAYMALFTKLPGKQGQRAAALWYGEKDDADRLALEAAAESRDKADREAKELEKTGMAILAPVAKKRRKEGQDKVESAVRQVANAGDQSTDAGRTASRDRLRKIAASAGAGGPASKRIELAGDPLTKAIAEGDEAGEIGARLARADETTDIAPAEVEAAFKQLRQLATDAADRAIEAKPELEAAADTVTKQTIDGYFDRLKAAFDANQKRRPFAAMIAGRGGSEERAAKALGFDIGDLRDLTGQTSDINRNKALLARGGELDEWGELFFALTKSPKDIERVKTILGSKTYSQVQALAEVYGNRTGRSLERDLAGSEAEELMAKVMAGDLREQHQEKRSLLMGGQFDRDLAEKTGPAGADATAREAHLLNAEGTFLYRRIGALERRVLENRGLFAKARDWAENEEKAILDRARRDAEAARSSLASAITPDRGTTWKPGEEGTPLLPNLEEARRQVIELRRVEQRMTHAVGIYKEATRKAYDEFVEIMVTIASTAAGLGAVGIWITAARTIAATVGTKFLLKGNEYTVDEFLADVQGGLVGVAGDFAKLGFKQLAAPYLAGKLARMARKLGVSKEFYAKVEARLGAVTLRQAEHTIGSATQNVIEGKGVTEGQGLGDRLKGEAIGQITGPLDEKIKARKAAKAIVKRARSEAGEEPDNGPSRRTEEDEADSGRGPARQGGGGSTEDVATGSAGSAAEPEVASPAAGSDEAPIPRVSMALSEPTLRAGKPAPPAEPAPAPRATPGALDGPEHMDAPHADGSAADKKPRRGEADRPAAEPAAPHALTGDGPDGAAPKSLEYPPGAVQLNAPGGPSAPAAGTHAAAEDLKAQPRSDRFQQQTTQRLREAEERMRMVNDLGMTEGPMHGDALRSLRDAQSEYDVAHGKRAATLEELRRIADDDVGEAGLEYALAKDSDTWKAREKAEREHAAAIEAQRRAKSAVAAARAWVLNVQGRDPDPTTMKAAFDAFDASNAGLKAATQSVGSAAAGRERAAAADWRSRRAWTALRMAREQQTRASGRATPPPPPGVRKGSGPTHGPATPLEEGPGPRRFTPELWDKEMVIQLKNTVSLREHEELVYQMLREDPTREIGLFRNSKTGEWIVVRGKKMTVVVESDPGSGDEKGGRGPRGAGQKQRWKELLDHGDVGEWELIAHSHPTERGQGVARIAQYPSGYEGDFSVLRTESDRDGRPRSSTIYYLDNGVRRITTFGYDPRNMRPYWIQLPGEPPRRFSSLQAYHNHLAKSLGEIGIVPDLKAIPSLYSETFGFEGTDGEDGEP